MLLLVWWRHRRRCLRAADSAAVGTGAEVRREASAAWGGAVRGAGAAAAGSVVRNARSAARISIVAAHPSITGIMLSIRMTPYGG